MKNKIIIFIVILIFILAIISIGILIYQKDILEQEKNSLINKISDSSNQINMLNNENAELKNSIEDTITALSDNTIFDNTSIEGLEPISQETAINNFNKYIEKNKCINNEENKNKKLLKVEIEDQYPNNSLSYEVWKFNKQPKTADFTRKCYTLYYQIGDFNYLEGYVDYYTGKVIGGYIHGV